MSDVMIQTGRGSRAQGEALCSCCRAELTASKQAKRFCSERCRLLSWAAGELLKAIREGRAEGMIDLIREMSDLIGQEKRS
jgi:hypothetical protein